MKLSIIDYVSLQFQSDLHFWHGLLRIIKSRSAHATGKTYLMRFDVDGELNMFKALKKAQHIKGACHADDIFYLFTTSYHETPEIVSKELQTITKMVGMFTSFAITGDPNCDEVSHVNIAPCSDTNSLNCINITIDDVTEIPLPEMENLQIWDIVYETHDVALY